MTVFAVILACAAALMGSLKKVRGAAQSRENKPLRPESKPQNDRPVVGGFGPPHIPTVLDQE